MFFKDFPNNRKKINRAVVFSSRSLPATSNTDETFQQHGKEDSLKRILKSSANIEKIS